MVLRPFRFSVCRGCCVARVNAGSHPRGNGTANRLLGPGICLAIPGTILVGQNAFAHEAGIHQHGMLKHRETYEIMRPEDVGLTKTELVLGKHSGKHALRDRIVSLGYHLSDEQMQRVFDNFKSLADRKKTVYDADIEPLAETEIHSGPSPWALEAI